MTNHENTYWNRKGRFQDFSEALQKLIPFTGEVADAKNNPALEKFRIAVNVYYDLYNNGLCNRGRQFPKVFGFGATQYRYRVGRRGYRYYTFENTMYSRTEEALDSIILAAAAEQLGR